MNCLVKQRAITPQNEARDKEIAIGIMAVLMTLATQQGWGAKRLRRLNDQVYEFVQKELIPARTDTKYFHDYIYGKSASCAGGYGSRTTTGTPPIPRLFPRW